VVDASLPFSGRVNKVRDDGSTAKGPIGRRATGYAILDAKDLDRATRMAKDYVAIYERISVAAALDQTGTTTLLDLANSTPQWMQAEAPMA